MQCRRVFAVSVEVSTIKRQEGKTDSTRSPWRRPQPEQPGTSCPDRPDRSRARPCSCLLPIGVGHEYGRTRAGKPWSSRHRYRSGYARRYLHCLLPPTPTHVRKPPSSSKDSAPFLNSERTTTCRACLPTSSNPHTRGEVLLYQRCSAPRPVCGFAERVAYWSRDLSLPRTALCCLCMDESGPQPTGWAKSA